MTTFQKLRKCDSVLLWLGESKFAEMLPLQNCKGVGPLQEWTLASECINHLHEKNIATKRFRKPMSITSTDIASVTPPRGTKRKRAEIDYRQYHKDGTVTVKSPETTTSKKILPLASAPSESRIASQEYISQERRSASKLGTTVTTAMKSEIVKKEPVISNRITRISHKLVKEEPNIRLVHRKEKLMGPVKVIHPSGKLCKSSNRGGFFDDELPDLPTVSTPLPQLGSRTGQTVHSPPAVQRASSRQRTCTASSTQCANVSDVLSGYISTLETPMNVVTTKESRVVQTPRSIQAISSVLSGYIPLSSKINQDAQQLILPSDAVSTVKSRSVVTSTHVEELENDRPVVQLVESRIPTTNEQTYQMDDLDDLEQAEMEAAAERDTELHLLLDDDHDESRAVVTEKGVAAIEMDEEIQPPTRAVVTEDYSQTINDNQDIQEDDTETQAPSRAAVTDDDAHPIGEDKSKAAEINRDQTELEVAETLLQLQSTDVDTEPDDNELIMPVDAPKQDDFIKDMTEAEAKTPDAADIDEKINKDKDGYDDEIDDDATVIYELEPQAGDKSSPKKGRVTFKHYGIR